LYTCFYSSCPNSSISSNNPELETSVKLDTISLLIAGAQSVAWIIPISLSIVGIGLVLVKKRIH